MRRKYSALMVGTCLFALAAACCGQAFAQQTEATQGNSSEIQEVVVTATRTKSKLQTVPLAVSVVTGEGLQRANIKDVTSLTQVNPSIQYDPSNDGSFQIRGVGTLAYDSAAEKAVGMVVDDVVMSLAGGGAGANGLTDVDRVEVLRGPQGTLFGKNTTAGVIQIITKRPKLGVYEGNASVQYGEHNDYNIFGNLNIPLGDKWAARLSAFADGQTYLGKYTKLNNKDMISRDEGARLRFLYKPTDDFDLVLSADYSQGFNNQAVNSLAATSSTAVYDASVANGTVPGVKNANWAGEEDTMHRKLYGTSATANWQVGNFAITSVTAYRHSLKEDVTPSDPVPIDNLPINQGGHEADQVTQEFRLTNTDSGPVSYLLGALYYHFDDKSSREQAGTLGAVPPPLILTLTNGVGHYRTRINSKALFGNLTFHMTQKLSLLTGLRYTEDESYASSYSTPLTYPGRTVIGLFPDLGFQETKIKSDNISYKLGLQYQARKNVMLYLTNSTGYKGPGTAYYFGTKGEFSAEHVNSWEAGLKSDLFSRRLRVNVSLFDNEYKDFQAQEFLTSPTFYLHIFNAGELTSKGVELETIWKASPEFQLSFAATYADSVYANYPKNDGVGNITILSGVALTNAPKWSYVIAPNYEHVFGSGYVLNVDANYAWHSKVYSVVNDPASIMDAYGLLNGRITLTPPKANWSFGLYGRNLTDQFYRGFVQPGSPNTVQLVPADARRTIGVFLEGHF